MRNKGIGRKLGDYLINKYNILITNERTYETSLKILKNNNFDYFIIDIIVLHFLIKF